MKKLHHILILVLLVCMMPAYSAATFPVATSIVVNLSGTTGDSDIDQAVLQATQKGVVRSLDSRLVISEAAPGAVEVTLGDPQLDATTYPNAIRFTAWLRLSYDGRSYTTGVAVIGKKVKDIVKQLPSVVSDQLRYDSLEVIPIKHDGLTLDYVWNGSLSSWLDPQLFKSPKRGQRLLAMGANGKPVALVVTSDLVSYEDRTVASYSPLYAKNPQPGLPLVAGPNWTGVLSFPLAVDLSGFAVEFSAMRSMSWYPWAPAVKGGVWFELSKSPLSIKVLETYVMPGMQVEVPLGGLFDTNFTLVEDAAIGAAVYFGVGARIPLDSSQATFIFGGQWEVWYRHTPSVHWGWALHFGSQYWAQVANGAVMMDRATSFTVAPAVIFSW